MKKLTAYEEALVSAFHKGIYVGMTIATSIAIMVFLFVVRMYK
jgi:hypothetical protein